MITEGQELWAVYNESRRGQSCFVTVEKIGRKWATLKGYYGRINKDTLAADGGQYSSPFQCYESKEEYEEKALTQRMWDSLRKRLPYSAPDHLLPIDIGRIAGILKIDIEAT